jgi:hypothetical protein
MCKFPMRCRAVAGSRRLAAGLSALVVVVGISIGPLDQPVKAQPPGPELFAKEPQTPMELWSAVDYLVRTNQVKKAVPYLERFMKSSPDDATLIAIRNRYGLGSILKLFDDPATRPHAKPLADALAAASRRFAIQPDRIARFIAELTETPTEQAYAVRHLREAGPYAIPPLVEALGRPGLSAHDRDLLIQNIGQLEPSVIPALAAALDSPDPPVASAAATALGLISDKQAVPFLTFPAASPATPDPVRTAAQTAIGTLTGRPFAAQSRTPVQTLSDAAWRYHRHQVEFSEDPVVVWSWDNGKKAPVPREVARTDAEAFYGLRFARQALGLDPHHHNAQVVQTSIALEKAVERVGYENFPAKDPAALEGAKRAGASVLSDVLKTAIADGKSDLAAAAATALGQITDKAALASTGRPHPLVDALYAPGRRTQFAAARVLANLAPTDPFPGSSRVVPTLARFVVHQAMPRAVIIDGNPNRGGQFAGFLSNLGYDSEVELTGTQGFVVAAETADVELILVAYDLHGDRWNLTDTLTNLKADSRTAGIPVFVYGPLDLPVMRPNLVRNYPGLRFLVQPGGPALLQQQIRGLPPSLSSAERAGYAREAAALLARIATQPKGPLAADLPAVEPALSAALNNPETGMAAALALGATPEPNAQRSLADVAFDPAQPPALRNQAAIQLSRSIQRFGPLVSAGQEARLGRALAEEPDPNVQASLQNVARVLSAYRANRRTAVGTPYNPKLIRLIN